MNLHKKKRKEFSQRLRNMGASIAIIPSGVPAKRSNDTEYRFRQESNFYYLTGFEEPSSICVIAPEHHEHNFIMFVRPKDEKEELWNGKRQGVEGVKENFGADVAFPIDQFDEKIVDYLKNIDRIFYGFGANSLFDRKICGLLQQMSFRRLRKGNYPNTLIEATDIFADMRLVKSPEEIEQIRRATDLTAAAHIAAMKAVKPGIYEYEIEALIDSIYRKNGGQTAFTTIVASGANATILHYTDNNKKIENSELVLIDSGCEYKFYNGDVTRTFPVNGKFSEPQRAIYRAVLDVQLALIEMIIPGLPIDSLNRKAIELLTVKMVELGLLKGSVKELIESKSYKKFYMHQSGHMLGLDVHDRNKIREGNDHRNLAPGMVLTVEPGLYIAADLEEVNPKYLGIGVRIEDDILVTGSGCEVLTAEIPKSIEEIEKVICD